MAVIFLTGFEAQQAATDGITLPGTTASYSTAQHRTGTASLRCNPASGASGYINIPGSQGLGWAHFGLYVASLPTVDRVITGETSAGFSAVKLTSGGFLTYYAGTTLIGTSSSALSTATWYWIGVKPNPAGTVDLLQINGTTVLNANATAASGNNGWIGCTGTEASAIDLYFDDYIYDNAGFLAPSNVGLLVPTADSAKGTGWTNDAAGTTNFFDATNNEPPVGIADTTASTGLHQIRNATSNANSNYDASMTTYSAAGVGAADAVLAVQPIIATAAPVTMSSKQGTVGVVSNPTITNIALGAGGTAGAFWSGAAASTYPTGWKVSQGTLTTSPTVTVGTAPVMRVTQVTSSTRIAMVCFMGMYVAWTPAAATTFVPYTNPYPQLLPQ